MDSIFDNFNPFHLINGQRPRIRTAESRRLLDPEPIAEVVFPEDKEMFDEFHSRQGEVIDKYFTSSRGINLFTRTLIPQNARGGVLVCHGYSSHLRFQHKKTMLAYALRGYLVTGVEYEGHGWSDGILALVKDAKLMVQDVDDFFVHMETSYPDLKWLVHGESLGGMVALNVCLNAQERGKPVEGALLVAPMAKIGREVRPHVLVEDALIVAAYIAPALSMTPSNMNGELIFKDVDVMKMMHSDPLLFVGRPRLATARELYHATIALEDRLPDFETPFFVIHGSEDAVTASAASQDLYDLSTKVKDEDKKVWIVDGGWHGLMWAEEHKEDYWNALLDWAEARV